MLLRINKFTKIYYKLRRKARRTFISKVKQKHVKFHKAKPIN